MCRCKSQSKCKKVEKEGRWYGQFAGSFWEIGSGVDAVPDVGALREPALMMDTDEIEITPEDFENMGLGEKASFRCFADRSEGIFDGSRRLGVLQ